MTRPPFEVADIIRQYGERFIETHRAWLTGAAPARAPRHRALPHRGLGRASRSVCALRPSRHLVQLVSQSALPEVLDARAATQWLAERQRELLPVGYAHVVFTLPHALSWLALQNKRVVYDLLFRASAATLLEVARTPKHLGAALGFLSVLHTWGQTLLHHPHVHCVVPAGGLSPDGTRWVHARPSFFLPVKVLQPRVSREIRRRAPRRVSRGHLALPGDLQRLADEPAFRRGFAPSFATTGSSTPSPRSAARCTCCTISRDTRTESRSPTIGSSTVTDDQVTFRWKDYRHGSQVRLMTLSAEEFLRRFCLHVLPKGFVRIRFYGFLAPRCRTEALPRCRHALGVRLRRPDPAVDDDTHVVAPCPHCGGAMVAIEQLTARRSPCRSSIEGLALDSS